MTKLRREARHRSLLSVLIVGLFFGALFVSIIPLEISSEGNEPVHQGGGIWENSDFPPEQWIVSSTEKYTSRLPTPSGWNYCTEMTIHYGIIISGTLILEGVDLIFDVGEPFPGFTIEEGGILILNGTGTRSSSVTEEDGDSYYNLDVAGILEVKGSLTSPVVITRVGVGEDSESISFSEGARGIFDNCTIEDVESSAIICNKDSKITFDNTEINIEDNGYPAVKLDECKIYGFNTTIIEVDSTGTEPALEISNIPKDDNVEIHNCTFIGGSDEFDGRDVNVINSEFYMHNCKFRGQGLYRINMEETILHLCAPNPNSDPPGLSIIDFNTDVNSEAYIYWYLNTTVHDQEGKGIEGVEINIQHMSQPIGPWSIYTNENGRVFWFPLLQRKYSLMDMVLYDLETYMVEAKFGEDANMKMVYINGILNDMGAIPPIDPADEIKVDEIDFMFDTRPDLESIAQNDPLEPFKGDNVKIDVTIQNLGGTDTLADITLYKDTPDPGNEIDSPQIGVDIKKGDSVLVTFYWDTTDVTTGLHTFWVTADNNINLGPDYNGDKQWENNNYTWDINVKVPGPDFLVTEFSPTITEMIIFNDTKDDKLTYATDGDIVKISTNITNQGHLTGSATVTFYNDSVEDGELTTDHFKEIGNIPITDMESGDFQMLSILWDTKDVANSSTTQEIWIRITDVDPEEEDSDNNEISTTFEVRKYYDFTLEIEGSARKYVIYPENPAATYTLKITNIGRADDDTITLSNYEYLAYPDPDDWNTHFSGKSEGEDVTVENLEIGESVQILLVVDISKTLAGGDYTITNITAISFGNSSLFKEISLNTSYGQPDLIASKITPKRADGKTGKKLIVNETSTISVEVSNFESAGTGENFLVNFTIKNETYVIVYSKEVSINGIDAFSIKETSISWKPTKIGNYHINITVDPPILPLKPRGLVEEINEKNNQKNETFTVKSEIPDNHFTLTGYVYDMDGKPVENAEVRLEKKGGGYTDKNFSNADGFYRMVINKGNYFEGDELIIEVFHPSDPSKCKVTIYAYSEDSKDYPYRLDLYLKIEGVDLQILTQGIKFYREKDRGEIDNPIFKEYTSITATIRNRGTEDANNFYVNFTWEPYGNTFKNGNKVKINIPSRGTVTIRDIVPNGTIEDCKNSVLFMVNGNWPPLGWQTVKIEISNSSGGVDDSYKDNNYAFRSVIVKDKAIHGSLRIFGTVYAPDIPTPSPVPFANVKITNLNPDLDFSIDIIADSWGRYSYDLSTYWEGDEIEITATGESGSGTQSIYAYSEDLEVRVDIMFDKYEVRVEISPISNETNQNLKAQYIATVTNEGTKTDTITLSIPDIPTGWDAELWNQDTGDSGETITIENLESKKSQKITVNVTAPNDGLAGTKVTMILNASSEQGVYDFVEFTTEIGKIYKTPSLDCDDNEKDALPGITVNYILEITNNGNTIDTISFEVFTSEDWKYTFSKTAVHPEADETVQVTLKVTVPVDAKKDDDCAITIWALGTGTKSSSVIITTTAEQMNKKPSLSIDTNAISTDPGNVAKYKYKVTNNANYRREIDIEIENSLNWPGVTFTSPVTLDPFTSNSYTLSVPVPTDEIADTSCTISIIAKAGTLESDSVSAVTTVNYHVEPGIDPTTISFEGTNPTKILPGESSTFKVKIENGGNKIDNVYVLVNIEPSWVYQVLPSIKSIDPKGSDTVEVIVKAPTNAILNDEANIEITTYSSNAKFTSDQIDTLISIDPEAYDVEINTDDANNEINPGESCVYNINVKNTGKLKDSFMLKVDEVSENKWNLEQDLISVGSIGMSNTTTVKVLVKAPKDALFEDKIRVFAISQTDPSVVSNEIELVTKLHQPPTPGEIIIVDEKKLFTNKEITFSVIGNIYAYTWDFNDGTDLQSGAITTHTFSQTRTYKVTVTAKDDFGAEGESTKSITVSNKKPDVQISKPKSNIKIGINEKIKFEGNVSDSNGIVEYITWDFGDGTKKIEKISKDKFVTTAEHSYQNDATFTITLTAEDNLGAEEIYSITIIVENQAPNATFSIKEDTVFETDKEIEFDGSLSSDPESSIIRYEWDFGDGTTGVGMNVTHIYSKEDSYYVTLTVTDENGETNTYSKTIEINKPEEKSYTIHWFGFIAMIAVFSLILIAILFGGREEFFSHINSSVKEGLAEKKAREAKPKPVVMPEIEDKLKKLEIIVKERTRLPPPKQIETPAGILEEIREPEVKDLTEVKEVEDEGLLEEVTEGEEGIEEELKKPGSIDELSEAFAATLVNLAKSRDELAKVEERIAESLKEDRDNRAAEIRKITQDYELTQRKIDALDSMAKMRRMQAGEEKIAAIFRGEIPEEEYGGLKEIEEAPLGELEEIEEESFGELEEIEEEEIEEELETLEEDEELLEELEDLEEEETTEEGEMAECGACGAMIPVAATKCPKCGAEFEEE